MSLKVCGDCGTKYLPDGDNPCPHCGSGSYTFDWEDPPKAQKKAAPKAAE